MLSAICPNTVFSNAEDPNVHDPKNKTLYELRQMQKRSRHHGRAVAQQINTGHRTQKDYQLTKLLLAVEPEIPNNNNKLAYERNPEGG